MPVSSTCSPLLAPSPHAPFCQGETIPGLPECGDSIDAATFGQILEMDDDEDDREFSKEIVLGFLDQAVNTFGEMDNGLCAPLPKTLIPR